MKIAILCSSVDHPVNDYLHCWIDRNRDRHLIDLVRLKSDLTSGDLLFLISCSEIISAEDRKTYKHVLVIHASDLPHGRGWSPHVWQILEGKERITLSLIEAQDKVDTGDIWSQKIVQIPRHALWDEINHHIFESELQLMDFAVENWKTIKPRTQELSVTPTYYRKRTSDDSRIDPLKSIENQFNLIRVCDPERYPAFFELNGFKYILRLEKANE